MCVCEWVGWCEYKYLCVEFSSLSFSLSVCAFRYDLLGTTVTFCRVMQFTLHTSPSALLLSLSLLGFVPPYSCALCASHRVSICTSTMTSFMQYAFQVQFNTSFNTTRANLYLQLRSETVSIWALTGVAVVVAIVITSVLTILTHRWVVTIRWR